MSDARTPLEVAKAAIVSLRAEVELYRARWLACVTPEEAERLRARIAELERTTETKGNAR